ncbi:hypothetical protein PSTT_08357 [Puccinia striiformis]|uniref:DUF6589 domain-containing protein n=1 Tax=Puccinia striiformis TaxID=27350 RepID=A0A2S4VCN7_9BASI|nr:hypothetical protein PSTT_08357 [Puccinia striiformis]
METPEWNRIIEEFYNRFCTAEARAKADELSTPSEPDELPEASPRLNNTLLRLHEFSTVVEANRAMKAGDIGRLMIVWKMWLESGAKAFNQTHKNIMLPQGLNVALRMAHSYDIFDQKAEKPKHPETKVQDSFVQGFVKIQREYRADPQMKRFKQHMLFEESAEDLAASEDVEEAHLLEI